MRLFFVICALQVIVSSVICYKVEKVFTSSGLTDGLFWDGSTSQLIFVDTYANKICSVYTLQNNSVSCGHLGKRLPAFAVPVEKNPLNQFVVGANNDILLITWDGKNNVEATVNKKLASVDLKVKGNAVNYGTVGPSNRLWFGTLNFVNGNYGRNMANVYSLDSQSVLKTQIPKVSLSSGLVWSLKNDQLYYDDSLTYEVAAYDYDSIQGTVANRTVVFGLKANNNVTGLAGRLTIDTKGNLWVPIYEGSEVIQINPKTKQSVQTIKIPAKRVGACTFGGPNLDTLYVTTIGYGFNNPKERTPADDKDGGSIYRVTGLGVKGLQAQRFKLSAHV